MAQHRYFVKNPPATPSGKSDWMEISGNEFYSLCKSLESKGRYFANMGDFTIEMTESQFIDWRRTKDRENYILDRDEAFSVLSIFDSQVYEEGNGEEAIPDKAVDVEEAVISNCETAELQHAIRQLDGESRYIIHALFFHVPTKTERELAEELGVTHQAINKRKKKYLKT